MKNINILFTYGVSLQTWKKYGLLEREIKLYKELAKKGYKIKFITFGNQEDFDLQKVIPDIAILPIYSVFPYFKNRFLRFFASFFSPFFLRKHIEPEGIFKTKQVFGAWVAITLGLLTKSPVILRCGFEPNIFAKKQKLSLLYRCLMYVTSFFSYHFSQRIIVATDADKNYVTTRFKIKKRKIEIIPNWVDTEQFRFSKPPGSNRLICICRLAEQKNLVNLIDALKNTEIGLDIAGHGPLYETLNEKIKSENLDVNLLGKVPNDQIPSLLEKYDSYILASHFEGNPKTLLEAMACGKIIITTSSPGIIEIVTNELNALVTNTDPTSLRETILKFYRDKEKYYPLGMQASKLIEQNYSLKTAVNKEIEIYESFE